MPKIEEFPVGSKDGVNVEFQLAHQPTPRSKVKVLCNRRPAEFTIRGRIIVLRDAPMASNEVWASYESDDVAPL